MKFPTRGSSLRRWISGLTWTGGSQVLSSISNAVVSLALVRSGGTPALGQFMIVFTVYLLALGFQRALITEPLNALSRTTSRGVTPADAEASSLTLSLLFFSLAGILAIGTASIVVVDGLVALAMFSPLLGAQDALRYVALRRDRPAIAAAMDGIWVAVGVLAWPLLVRSDVTVAVLVWGAGGALSASLGMIWLRIRPSPLRGAITWWRRDARELGRDLALAGIAYVMSDQVAVLVIASMVPRGSLGELRAAQLLLQPTALVLVAVGLFALPRLAEWRSNPDRDAALTISAASLALVLASLLVLIPLRGPISALLFGRVEPPTALVVILSVKILADAVATGFLVAFKAGRRGGEIVRSRVIAGSTGVGVVFVATAASGITGGAAGLAAQSSAYAVSLARSWRNVGSDDGIIR